MAGPEDEGASYGLLPPDTCPAVWFPGRLAGVTVPRSRIGGLLSGGQNLWEREESTLKLTARPGHQVRERWERLGEEERVRG